MGLFGKRSKEKSDNSNTSHEITLQNGQSHIIATTVDCLGDSCPRPQLITKKTLASSAANDVIEVMVDNPTSMEALPPMCPGLDATHLETIHTNDGWRVYIQKN